MEWYPPPWTPAFQLFETCAEYFIWETAVLRYTRAQLANVDIQAHSSKYFTTFATKCRADGTKRVHGSQFSRLNQPSVKKKKKTTNENVKKIAPTSVRVELKNLLSEEKIDKLEQQCKRLQCENAGLKDNTNSTTKCR